MKIREALRQQCASLALIRAAADEIAALDAEVRHMEEQLLLRGALAPAPTLSQSEVLYLLSALDNPQSDMQSTTHRALLRKLSEMLK